jgi:hypothetical protein
MMKNGQHDECYGTTADYEHALRAVLGRRVHPRHLAMLREHYLSPGHTTTWAALAGKVGYRTGNTVNTQYGTFAGRVAKELGVIDKPEGFWLYVLSKWAKTNDAKGHTQFTLRKPVCEAMKLLGLV